ncbi:hypothetical protein PG996_010484 [Apiospora saccharicola]|uniref:Uncharacterized protein n=1 Tax=Apiospora saccharicola TaxID=335842 RepID=A0ABR1UNR3_9PEZI
MGTRGPLLLPEEKPPCQETRKRSMTSASQASEPVNSDMRLAWMFVQGWRQRLQRGEQLLEEHREEDLPAGGYDGDAVTNGRRRSSLRKPKSVNWEL